MAIKKVVEIKVDNPTMRRFHVFADKRNSVTNIDALDAVGIPKLREKYNERHPANYKLMAYQKEARNLTKKLVEVDVKYRLEATETTVISDKLLVSLEKDRLELSRLKDAVQTAVGCMEDGLAKEILENQFEPATKGKG